MLAVASVAAAVATVVGAAPTAPWAVNGTCVLHILRQVEVDGMAMFSLRNKSRVLNLNSSQWAAMAQGGEEVCGVGVNAWELVLVAASRILSHSSEIM